MFKIYICLKYICFKSYKQKNLLYIINNYSFL